jgi:hypothetical protein
MTVYKMILTRAPAIGAISSVTEYKLFAGKSGELLTGIRGSVTLALNVGSSRAA